MRYLRVIGFLLLIAAALLPVAAPVLAAG